MSIYQNISGRFPSRSYDLPIHCLKPGFQYWYEFPLEEWSSNPNREKVVLAPLTFKPLMHLCAYLLDTIKKLVSSNVI